MTTGDAADATYARLAMDALSATPAPALLATRYGRAVIVLERLARGAGATHWYGVTSGDEFERMTRHLVPGSRVSLYFDQRFSVRRYDDSVGDELLRIAERDHGSVLGLFTPDGTPMAVAFPTEKADLAHFVASHGDHPTVFYGPFPSADNEPPDSVTLDLPDADEVTRSNPH
jgi:hypothetical protein